MSIQVIEANDENELINKIKDLDQGIILINRAFPVYRILRAKGFVWHNFYVYPVSTKIDDDVLEAIYILLNERKKLGQPHTRFVKEKTLSRRDILNPFGSLREYMNAPLIGPKGTLLSKSVKELLIQICPYNAFESDIENLLEQRCRECGICYSFLPTEVLESPLMPFAGIKELLTYLAKKQRTVFVIYFEFKREEEIYSFALSNENIGIYVPITGYTFPWWIPLLHYLNKIPAAILLEKNRYLEYLLQDLRSLHIEDIIRHSENIFELRDWKPKISPQFFKNDITSTNLIEKTVSFLTYEGKSFERFKPKALRSFRPKVNAESCILCGACVRVCPYKALEIETEPRTPRLLVKLNSCQGCFNCFYACPTDSFKGLEVLITYNGWSTLVQDELINCIYCGSPVGPRRKIEYTEKKLMESMPSDKVREITRVCPICRVKNINKTL